MIGNSAYDGIAIRKALGRIRRIGKRLDPLLAGALPLPPARLIGAGANGDTVKPCVEAVHLAKAGKVAPGTDERLLEGRWSVSGLGIPSTATRSLREHRCVADMVRTKPWPFPDDRFPEDLGAVVQRTVLDGKLPARLVAHDDEGSWMVADGVNDPNEPGACVATHISHVVASDPSVAELASLPPGRRAERVAIDAPWMIGDFTYEE